MDEKKYEFIVKKLMEFDRRLTTIESYLTDFKPFRSIYFGDTPDPLLSQAKELVKQYKIVSASLLQRRLAVGYARAARLLDQLEEKGIVGPGEGSKPRKVLKK